MFSWSSLLLTISSRVSAKGDGARWTAAKSYLQCLVPTGNSENSIAQSIGRALQPWLQSAGSILPCFKVADLDLYQLGLVFVDLAGKFRSSMMHALWMPITSDSSTAEHVRPEIGTLLGLSSSWVIHVNQGVHLHNADHGGGLKIQVDIQSQS